MKGKFDQAMADQLMGAAKKRIRDVRKFKKVGTLHDEDFMNKVKGVHDGTYKLTFDEEKYVKDLMAESPEMLLFKAGVFNEHKETAEKAKFKMGLGKIENLTGLITKRRVTRVGESFNQAVEDIEEVIDE